MQTLKAGIGITADLIRTVPAGYYRPTCPICDDLGMIIERDARGRNVTRPCSCGLAVRTQEKRLFEVAHIPKLPTPFYPCDAAKEYVEKINDLPRYSNWILFSGRAGSGKTSNAAWIAIEYITRYREQVKFYPAYAITRKIATTKGDARLDLVDDVIKTPLAVFDDLLKTFPRSDSFQYSDFFEATLEMLWGRYERKLPTVITTQRNFNELTTFDAALAGRIAESCANRVVLFDRDSRNWRIDNGRI